MTTAVCDSRTIPSLNQSSSATEGKAASVVLVVHMDRALKLATEYAKAKDRSPLPTASCRHKHMLRPSNMQEARARNNRADYEDVLRAAGSAAAAKLFRAAEMV